MEEKEIVKKNLELLGEFMKYANEHPEVLDSISAGIELIILPLDDKELYTENQKTVKKLQEKNISTMVIKFRKPELVKPEIELTASSTSS